MNLNSKKLNIKMNEDIKQRHVLSWLFSLKRRHLGLEADSIWFITLTQNWTPWQQVTAFFPFCFLLSTFLKQAEKGLFLKHLMFWIFSDFTLNLKTKLDKGAGSWLLWMQPRSLETCQIYEEMFSDGSFMWAKGILIRLKEISPSHWRI